MAATLLLYHTQVFNNITMEYGCCLNTIFSEFSGRRYEIVVCKHPRRQVVNLYSDEIDEQIEYAINTRDIYSACGITSGGFCAGVN